MKREAEEEEEKEEKEGQRKEEYCQRVDLRSSVSLRLGTNAPCYVGTPTQGHTATPSHLTMGALR